MSTGNHSTFSQRVLFHSAELHSAATLGRKALRALVPLALACAIAAPVRPADAKPPALDHLANQPILDWSTIAYERLVAHDGYQHSLFAVRVIAMMHLAQHDALQAIAPAFASYALSAAAEPSADAHAAVVAAAHAVLVAELPAQREVLDAELAKALASLPAGTDRERGRALGERAAAAVVALRAGDGADTPAVGDYTPKATAGSYQFVDPYPFAFAPGWRQLRPFALERPEQFRVAPPPALGSAKYTRGFLDVRAVGSKDSSTRTADETASGKFWYEMSDIGWNRIARVVAAQRHLGLQSTARLFALLNMAMSDAYVAGWDAKYHYDFWRPTTAIRAAAADGNPATVADTQWTSLESVPPVQDYPSTHSALGNAAAEVLAAVFGNRTAFAFTSTSALDPTVPRHFASFRQAADENARSRVVAGLHFAFSCDAGQGLGRKIGNWTVRHHLRRR